MPEKMDLQVTVDGFNIGIVGQQPFVPVQGTIKSGQFFATGNGTVAGFPNIEVRFQGTLDAEGLAGQYLMGTDGDLPPGGGKGEPIKYVVKPKPDETPTPTATPEKLYTAVVLKLNEETNAPLPGFQFNLYQGRGCPGAPIRDDVTDDDGFAQFPGLVPGPYSVQEKPEPGWNIVGSTCRDIDVPGAGAAGAPPCPIEPDQPFPQPGCDTFQSAARVVVRINATGQSFPVTLSGPTQIVRQTKPRKVDGRDQVDTEIVHLELTGTSPVGTINVHQSPALRSRGVIREQANAQPNQIDFKADSFFDVFFEVDVMGSTLHNDEPFRIACKIQEVPPYLCFYLPPIPDPIVLRDATGTKVATLVHGLHIPVGPKDSLIIVTNRAKATPTVTPSGTVPATVTPTATLTPPNDGDVNCDDDTTSIDALLVLQDVAGLLDLEDDPVPDCPGQAKRADVNRDGVRNAIDGALILQVSAGFLPGLPV